MSSEKNRVGAFLQRITTAGASSARPRLAEAMALAPTVYPDQAEQPGWIAADADLLAGSTLIESLAGDSLI